MTGIKASFITVATGTVIGKDEYAGGLVGSLYGSTITSSFWDIENSGQNGSSAGRGLTTKQMKSLVIFQNAGWANTTWIINDGEDYPRLAWEGTPGVPIPTAESIPLSGNGTQKEPYRIETAKEFAQLSWHAAAFDRCFVLTADLDLSGIQLSPIGEFGPFTGIFDGRGHVLRNAVIDLPISHYVGIFSHLESGGEIRNLRLDNATVIGRSFVGGLVGKSSGIIHNCFISSNTNGTGNNIGGLAGITYGAIYDCFVSGSVTRKNGVSTGNSYVGGLCETNGDQLNPIGTVRNCWVTSDVNDNGGRCIGGFMGVNYGAMSRCSNTGTVWGGDLVGGLVGSNCSGNMELCYSSGPVSGVYVVGGLAGVNENAIIRNCYSSGSATGQLYVGGLIGYVSSASVINCFSSGKPTGTTNVGGLCGYVDSWGGKSTDNKNFWDTQSSEIPTSAMGKGKTTAEMKTLSTYSGAGWDFVGESANGTEDTWRMCGDGIDYPRLSWEFSQGGDMDCPNGVGLEDLAYLAGRWMTETSAAAGAADGNGDGKVDLQDFGILSDNWMR